jgi:hypothetical protein
MLSHHLKACAPFPIKIISTSTTETKPTKTVLDNHNKKGIGPLDVIPSQSDFSVSPK